MDCRDAGQSSDRGDLAFRQDRRPRIGCRQASDPSGALARLRGPGDPGQCLEYLAGRRMARPDRQPVHRHALSHALHSLRSEEHTSELQPLMRISYAVFCLQTKNKHITLNTPDITYILTSHKHTSTTFS